MTEPRPAPYPADTRAKGWRFELDYERIEQSATWGLTTLKPEARPWLLMTWYTAWKQTPCGSMPADPEVFAGLIGASEATFSKHRKVLLRGWWLADDGRLYHDTLVLRVLEMMKQRRSDADRQAANRAKKAAELQAEQERLTAVSRVTPTEVQCESSTGTGTSTREEPKPKAARERAAPPPARPHGVSEQVWTDWLALRKSKRANVTLTVLEEAQREAVKAGLTLDAFLRAWVVRGSQGMQADWLKPNERGQTAFDRKAAEAEKWMHPKSSTAEFDYIDMEASSAAPLALR